MVRLVVTVEQKGRPDPDAMRGAMRRVQAILLEGAAETFAQEGPGWAPLAKSTLERRRRGRSSFAGMSGARILQDTGSLRGSVTALSHPQGHRYADGLRAEIGTHTPYAVYHQEGTSRMPQRRFLFIREQDVSRIEDAVADGFMGSLGGAA